ncbi:MAG: hypothetical protein AAB521_03530 [Patescibacteria group bacterium]
MTRFLSIAVQAGAFISAFAAIAAGLIMTRVTKKFGTGILASGFKTISVGIFLIALGIIFDAGQVYFNLTGNEQIIIILTGLKEIFFVAGTYIIVIGSKRTADKLETLTK